MMGTPALMVNMHPFPCAIFPSRAPTRIRIRNPNAMSKPSIQSKAIAGATRVTICVYSGGGGVLHLDFNVSINVWAPPLSLNLTYVVV